jgi:hypothetical protein
MEETIQTEPGKTLALSDVLTPEEIIVYSRWLHLMNRTGVDYGVGGGFALFAYTGIWRSTKDLDIFLKPADLKKVLDLMTDAGYTCEVTYPVWLAKVQLGPYCMDLIFGGNFHGCRVDDLLLSRRRPARLLEAPTHLMAPEALFASKAHIARHHRFDGADLARLIYCLEGKLDWERLLEHLQGHGELLLWHLLFFSVIYPSRSAYLPRAMMASLFKRLQKRWKGGPGEKEHRGAPLNPAVFDAAGRPWGADWAPDPVPLANRKGEAL